MSTSIVCEANVLAEELAVRDDRRFRQGLRLSKLQHHKTLDEYGFTFQPELDPRKIKDLATSPRRGQSQRGPAGTARGRQDAHRGRALGRRLPGRLLRLLLAIH
nr:ATP-binding protein [Streptomyces barringtoniae]